MDQIWLCELENLTAYCEKVLRATPETEHAAAIAFGEREIPNILTVDGDTAEIAISGTLSNRPSIIARFFGLGSTTYGDILEAIATVAADDRIKTVRLAIDSPGGGVTGLDEVWIALRELGKKKQVIAENRGLMASAAYWIASAAHEITASSPAAETGSIGVYALVVDYTEADKKAGIKEIRIVSKNAPDKNPDVATGAGLKAFQSRIDALERVFIDRVAEGRGVSPETVAKTYGRGGLLIAADPDGSKPSALSVGMIDAITAGYGGKKRDKRRAAVELEPEAGSPPFKDLPIIDGPWDSAAAIKRVRAKTGSTEKPSASYKTAFFWYDPADSENFGAYKLPFVDVDGGALKAVRRGVFAAKGAMAGARGNKPKIPAGDVAAVNSHIDKYVQKIEKQDQQKKTAAAVTRKKEGEKMTLTELLAKFAEDHPELEAEINAIRTAIEAETEGARAAAAADLKARNEAALPILTGDYPEKVKDIARSVIKGERSAGELAAAVETVDALREAGNTGAATGESADQGPTPPAPPVGGDPDGEIRTDQDYNESVARFRAGRGMEA